MATESTRTTTGEWVRTDLGALAFVPDPLPRGLQLPARLFREIGDTRALLGQLGEGVRSLPRAELLIRPFQKREAVLSSRIEGTRTTLEEAFVNEATGSDYEVGDDAREVRNYERALHLGIRELGAQQPLNLHLLRALHAQLLAGTRGQDRLPGEFRVQQVWLGSGDDIRQARFVPPPGLQLPGCLAAFEEWLKKPGDDDPLVRVALAHYQFEAIHPFLDGNGRTGRLLIVLQMVNEGLLEQPWLYVSPFLERERERYYGALHAVSTQGLWMEWIGFFARAVRASARETIDRLHRLRQLESDFTARLADQQSRKPLQILPELFAVPFMTVPRARSILGGVTPKTARYAIERLVDKSILEPVPIKVRGARGRPATMFRCREILEIVRE